MRPGCRFRCGDLTGGSAAASSFARASAASIAVCLSSSASVTNWRTTHARWLLKPCAGLQSPPRRIAESVLLETWDCWAGGLGDRPVPALSGLRSVKSRGSAPKPLTFKSLRRTRGPRVRRAGASPRIRRIRGQPPTRDSPRAPDTRQPATQPGRGRYG